MSNIVLIGYRGSGKTSVGRTVAARLGRTLIDTDAMIERAAGMTVRAIFAERGEPGFRELERRAVAEAAAGRDAVISCGGGVVLDPRNVAALRAGGRVAWLRCGAGELHRRLNADPATGELRPNLTAVGGLEEVRRLLEVRTPLYEAAADAVIDVERLGIEEAADAVIAAFVRPAGPPGVNG
jgi:shikimate kinase